MITGDYNLPAIDIRLVDVMLACNPLTQEKSGVSKFDENSLRSLDFYRADFNLLKSMLEEVNWSHLRSLCSFEDFPAIFTDTVFQFCSSCAP